MIRIQRFLLVVSAIALLTGCKKTENTIPILSVTPSALDIDVVSGNVVTFQISGRSDNSTLSRLLVTTKLANGFTTTARDSALSGTKFNWNWEYLVPHATENYSMEVNFTLYDANGETMSTRRTLYVTLGAVLLTETTGHQFYSRNSVTNPESAFDLEERLPVLFTVDSTRRDIQDNPVDGTVTELSRSWITPAGGRLVRFNSFDYANATNVSLRNAFNSGTPLEQINNVAEGDIILMRLGSLAPNVGHYAAVRLITVVDDAGSADNDRYVFNLKWAVFPE